MVQNVSRTTVYDPSFVRANIAFLSSRINIINAVDVYKTKTYQLIKEEKQNMKENKIRKICIIIVNLTSYINLIKIS
ncbi:hypothetical protein ALC56_02087 [Trachymyrmex septentrionalis]|uniref:Uncharacterized protein n=1 Tax=Trachymyrmex septentrionalis TaxID=34720 RepID=A0A195FSE4_9HYME|nr:hypothetical protein ALC56_02087 [Trachymyrmex septentrionalis]